MQTIQGVWHELSGSENAQAASQLVESDSSAFKFLDLTRTQRMYGFGACILGGFVISLLGAILFTLVSNNLWSLRFGLDKLTRRALMQYRDKSRRSHVSQEIKLWTWLQ